VAHKPTKPADIMPVLPTWQRETIITRRFLLLFLVSVCVFICVQNLSWATKTQQITYLPQQQQQQKDMPRTRTGTTNHTVANALEGGNGRDFSLAMFSQCSADYIVKESYSNVYRDFVERCSPEKFYKKECFRPMTSTTRNNRNHDNNNETSSPPPPPWWFESLRRGATTSLFIDAYHQVWFDSPPLRVCRIEKVASDSWREIHKKVKRDNNSSPLRIGAGTAGLGWTGPTTRNFPRVVFFRDPLERFLSGYINKCIRPDRRKEGHCEPDGIYDLRGGLSHPQGLQSFLSTFPLAWNVHFVPQALYCDGLFRTWREYEFVGSMDDLRFKNDMQRLIRRYPGPLVKYIQDEFPFLKDDNSTSFRAALPSGKNGQGGHATHASKQVLDYYNPDSVRMALQYYSIDYVTLNLTIPEWVQEILDKDCLERYGYTAAAVV
jgi:hypothetical protein